MRYIAYGQWPISIKKCCTGNIDLEVQIWSATMTLALDMTKAKTSKIIRNLDGSAYCIGATLMFALRYIYSFDLAVNGEYIHFCYQYSIRDTHANHFIRNRTGHTGLVDI